MSGAVCNRIHLFLTPTLDPFVLSFQVSNLHPAILSGRHNYGNAPAGKRRDGH